MPDLLTTRRTIRRFKPDPVPDSVLRRLLTAATFAPSAHNLQPWRFVVLRDAALKRRLGEALTDRMRRDMRARNAPEDEIEARVARSLRRLAEAPVVVLLCRDVTVVRAEEPQEHTMAVQSVALAGGTLLLAAHAGGLGANWICWPLYAPQETRAALGLPSSWEPQAMILLGYPAEEPAPPPRTPIDDITLWH